MIQAVNGPKNAVVYSDSLDNAAWDKATYPVNVTPNAALSPWGTMTANLVVASGGLNRHAAQQRFTAYSGSLYTMICYAKPADSNYLLITENGDAAYHGSVFNISTGSLGAIDGTVVNRFIEWAGNGWWRCAVVLQRTNAGTYRPNFGPASVAGVAVYTPAVTPESVYIAGCQAFGGYGIDQYVPTLEVPVT